jgi:RNA polymerase sigma factor (sigma-70 family)
VSSSPSPNAEALLGEVGFVHRLANALVRDQHLASEVAQDAFVAALQQAQPAHNLRSWLAAVTRRLAGKAHRDQRERHRHEASAARDPRDGGDERTMAHLRLHQQLVGSVLSLPEPYRTVVTLRFFEELPPRAIAQRFGTSSEVVRQQLHRGLSLLRTRLDSEFGDRGAWLFAFLGVGWVGTASSPWWIVSVLAMKKTLAAAAVLLCCGGWWLSARWQPLGPQQATGNQAGSISASANDLTASAAPTIAANSAPERVLATTPEASCTAHVVDAADAPVADAAVHCWSADGIVGMQTSDTSGHVAFGALRGPGGFVVIVPGRPPRLEVVANRSGAHRLALPTGTRFTGQLFVDGQPAAGWPLTLHGIDRAVHATIPKDVAVLLESAPCEVVTNATGRFAFVGLEAHLDGSLSLPQPLWLLPESGGTSSQYRSYHIGEPREDVQVFTTQLPTLSGRVLWDDSGEPVARPLVDAICTFADGESSPMTGSIGRGDGRFAVGFDCSHLRYPQWCDPANRPAITDVRFEVRADGCNGSQRVHLGPGEFVPGTEVPVRLQRAPITHFLALDELGHPLAGARVAAQGISDPTDASGHGTFFGTANDVRSIGAPGHRIGPCAPRAGSAGTVADPLVFTVMPQSRVRIQLHWPTAMTPAVKLGQLRCELRADEALFAGSLGNSELARRLTGISIFGTARSVRQPDGSVEQTNYRLNLRIEESGLVDLPATEPGVACVLAVLDAVGADLATLPFVTPAAGKTLDLQLQVKATKRTIAGLVLTSDGRPLAGANVSVSRTLDATRSTSQQTDAQGHFEFQSLFSEASLALSVQADGFVWFERKDLLPVDDRDNHVLQLEAGHTVTTRVLDDTDTLVPVWCRPRGLATVPFDRLRDGEVRWRDLPSGKVTFACRLGQSEFRVEHDTSQPIAILRVPRPARLLVTTPPGWQKPFVTTAHPMARVTREDATESPMVLGINRAEADAEVLLPGRYRIELTLKEYNLDSKQSVDHVLGTATEVILTAGELRRVEMP